MPVDADLANTFATEKDLQRVHIRDAYPNTHPVWIDEISVIGK